MIARLRRCVRILACRGAGSEFVELPDSARRDFVTASRPFRWASDDVPRLVPSEVLAAYRATIVGELERQLEQCRRGRQSYAEQLARAEVRIAELEADRGGRTGRPPGGSMGPAGALSRLRVAASEVVSAHRGLDDVEHGGGNCGVCRSALRGRVARLAAELGEADG
jgi:hypothetical protein